MIDNVVIRPFGTLPEFKNDAFNDNFVQFVSLQDFLKSDDISRIKDFWNEAVAKEAKIEKGIINHDIRKSNVVSIDPENEGWIYDKLGTACILVNANKYKFNILGFQSKLQLTTYNTGDFYGWHMDSGRGRNSIRKLSITIQLSDPDEYDGGELQFLSAKKEINAPKEKGTAIVFPSYVYHRVQPVIRGTRKSLVGWIAGPPYR